MKINYNQFLAVMYSDIFDWPLTAKESRAWSIDKGFQTKFSDRIKVSEKGGYYFLPGREKLIKQRLEKGKISEKKKMMAEVMADLLSKIPTVEAIFLTGSVAIGSAKKDGDIDLMIITTPNTLWLTRVVTVFLLKGLKSYGNGTDRICPNIFLDSNHLEMKEKNLYAAHEILQAKCLFDRGGIESKWVRKNSWTANYLPTTSKIRRTQTEKRRNNNLSRISDPILRVLPMFEPIAFGLQYLYMKKKITNERLGWGYAFFHPNSLGPKVEDKFRQRLLKYSG